jgi:hypothetical protein
LLCPSAGAASSITASPAIRGAHVRHLAPRALT